MVEIDDRWTYTCKPRASDFRMLRLAIRAAYAHLGLPTYEQMCLQVVWHLYCRANHLDNFYLRGDGRSASRAEREQAYSWLVNYWPELQALHERERLLDGTAHGGLN